MTGLNARRALFASSSFLVIITPFGPTARLNFLLNPILEHEKPKIQCGGERENGSQQVVESQRRKASGFDGNVKVSISCKEKNRKGERKRAKWAEARVKRRFGSPVAAAADD